MDDIGSVAESGVRAVGRTPSHLSRAKQDLQARLLVEDTPHVVEELLQERLRAAHDWLVAQALPRTWWIS